MALDAASRGLRTALVEADDFAAGTSSKSSKLVHGGLRYLQNGDIRLVYEALHERQRLRRNAPHLVKLLPFMIPILNKDGVIPRRVARALGSAMWMYDLTGGFRIGKFHRRLKADAAFEHLPTMPRERIAGGYLYYDATADDARLVLTVLRTAVQHGAAVANRCRVVELATSTDGHAEGVVVDTGGGSLHGEGPGGRQRDRGVGRLDPSTRRRGRPGQHPSGQGRASHGAVGHGPQRHRRRHPGAGRQAQPVRRAVGASSTDGTFEHTYVGTTDTDYEGRLDDPPCTAEDIEYVLAALNAAVTTDITPADVTGVWAGLPPARQVGHQRPHRRPVATSPGDGRARPA